MLAREIMNYMEGVAPKGLAYEDDIVGLVMGERDREVKKLGLAWAVTDYVLEQAGLLSASKFVKAHKTVKPQKQFHFDKKKQASEDEETVDMLVLHEYPFFEEVSDRFSGLSFFEKPVNYKRLKDIISKEVCIYVARSNLDETEGGTADIVAKVIGMKVDKNAEKIRCGRFGKIPESSLANIVSNLKTAYSAETIRIVGDPESSKKFETVGCFVGSGLSSTDVIEEFYLRDCQALVSSGLTENAARYASELGLVLIEIERSKLERPVMNNLAEKMQVDLKNVFINLYECEDVISYM